MFCMFINGLPSSVKYTFLYEDNAQLYKFLSSDEVSLAIDEVNLDLQEVCKWASSNKLELKAGKSQATIIGGKDVDDYP